MMLLHKHEDEHESGAAGSRLNSNLIMKSVPELANMTYHKRQVLDYVGNLVSGRLILAVQCQFLCVGSIQSSPALVCYCYSGCYPLRLRPSRLETRQHIKQQILKGLIPRYLFVSLALIPPSFTSTTTTRALARPCPTYRSHTLICLMHLLVTSFPVFSTTSLMVTALSLLLSHNSLSPAFPLAFPTALHNSDRIILVQAILDDLSALTKGSKDASTSRLHRDGMLNLNSKTLLLTSLKTRLSPFSRSRIFARSLSAHKLSPPLPTSLFSLHSQTLSSKTTLPHPTKHKDALPTVCFL